MRLILTLVFSLFFVCSSAQIIYKSKMSVLELRGRDRVCVEDTTVVWGIYKDTITFVFLGQVHSYRELKTLNDWGGDGKLKRKIENYIFSEEHFDPSCKVVPVENIVTCDKFLIRFIISKEGYIIFITALDRTPAYILCFGVTCNLCNL